MKSLNPEEQSLPSYAYFQGKGPVAEQLRTYVRGRCFFDSYSTSTRNQMLQRVDRHFDFTKHMLDNVEQGVTMFNQLPASIIQLINALDILLLESTPKQFLDVNGKAEPTRVAVSSKGVITFDSSGLETLQILLFLDDERIPVTFNWRTRLFKIEHPGEEVAVTSASPMFTIVPKLLMELAQEFIFEHYKPVEQELQSHVDYICSTLMQYNELCLIGGDKKEVYPDIVIGRQRNFFGGKELNNIRLNATYVTRDQLSCSVRFIAFEAKDDKQPIFEISLQNNSVVVDELQRAVISVVRRRLKEKMQN